MTELPPHICGAKPRSVSELLRAWLYATRDPGDDEPRIGERLGVLNPALGQRVGLLTGGLYSGGQARRLINIKCRGRQRWVAVSGQKFCLIAHKSGVQLQEKSSNRPRRRAPGTVQAHHMREWYYLKQANAQTHS